MTTTGLTGDGVRPTGSTGRGGRTRAGLMAALAVVAAVGLGAGLTGCTGGPGRAPGSAGASSPGADELARQVAAQDAGDLLLLARRGASTTPALAKLYERLGAVHRAHLAALGAPEPAAPGPASGSASGAAAGSAPGSAAGSAGAAAPKDVLAAERAAAGRALRAAQTVEPAMATLLVRIAAARAVDADLLARAAKLPVPGPLQVPAAGTTGTAGAASGAPSSAGSAPAGASAGSATGPASGSAATPGEASGPARSAGSRQALNDLLLGEHAATFAYGLLAARASSGQQALAQGYWQDHLVARDLLESRIVAVGDSPPVPAPAYDVGPAPGSPQQVAALAGRVERGLASVASSAVASADPDVRPLAAEYLVTAARRAARWGAADPLPGEPAPPAAATGSATGTG